MMGGNTGGNGRKKGGNVYKARNMSKRLRFNKGTIVCYSGSILLMYKEAGKCDKGHV